MESEREGEQAERDPLEDRKLGDQGNTDAKVIVPKDEEPSDEEAEEEADEPPDERT